MTTSPPFRISHCLVIFLLALGVRCLGITFGLPAHYRPDEQIIVSNAFGALNGEFKPEFMVWPHLQIHLTSAVFLIVDSIERLISGPSGAGSFLRGNNESNAYLAARSISAIAGALNAVVISLIGNWIVGARCGILAGCLLSLDFLHARESQFARIDSLSNLFALLALFQMVAFIRKSERRRLLGSGFFIGLANSTKLSYLTLLPAIIVTHLLSLKPVWPVVSPVREVRLATLYTAAIVTAFFLGSPWRLIDFNQFIESLQLLRYWVSSGTSGTPPSHGFAWIYANFSFAFTPASLVLALTGIVAAFHPKRSSTSRSQMIVLMTFAASTVATIVLSKMVFFRYLFPLTPLIALFCALGIHALSSLFTRPGFRKLFIACAFLLAAAGSFIQLYHNQRILRSTDTRSSARDWIHGSVPSGSTLCILGPRPGKPQLGENYTLVVLDRDSRWNTESATTLYAECEWFMIDSYPLPLYSPAVPDDLQTFLEQNARKVASFSGVPDSQFRNIHVDYYDAYYVPISGLSLISHPGPSIAIWQTGQSD